MIDINLARFLFASLLICSQYSKQLKAMSMISQLSSKCCDFSLVNMTMNDLIKASRNSLFYLATSFCYQSFMNDRPDYETIQPVCDSTDWSPIVLDRLLLLTLELFCSPTDCSFSVTFMESIEFFGILSAESSLSCNRPSSFGIDYTF